MIKHAFTMWEFYLKTGLGFLLLLILIAAAPCIKADEIVMNDYSYKDGLTTNSVNSTFRDSKGFLWICSLNGLYRYDGYNFNKINNHDKILNVEILSIIEDENNNFWISTARKGVVFYDSHNEEMFALKFNINISFNVNKTIIFKNKVWLATDSGLIFFDHQKKYTKDQVHVAKVLLPEPNNLANQKNRITYFYVAEDSVNLWIGTNGGLYVLNTANNIIKVVNSHPQNAIRSIISYKNNVLAGSWDGGVFSVNAKSLLVDNDETINWMNKILQRKRVISLCYDNLNQLWVATYGDGLYRFNLRNREYVFYGSQEKLKNASKLKSDIINHIFYDKSGILWLSMNQPALTKIYFQKNNLKVVDIETYFAHQSFEISSVVKSYIFDNNVWISTTRSGLIRFDIANNKLYYYSNDNFSRIRLQTNEVSLIYEDKQGNLWLVYRNIGLYVIPAQLLSQINNTGRSIQPIDANNLFGNMWMNSYITSFYEDTQGRLWIGLWGALYVLKLDDKFNLSINSDELKAKSKSYRIFSDETIKSMPFPISPTQAIIEINKNTFYVGTRDEGIIEIKEISEDIFSARIAHEINDLLPCDYVKSFCKVNDHYLWIGTNAGACLFDLLNKNIRIIDEKNGISSNNINHIIFDNKSIWLSTSYGISNISTNNFQVKNYLFESEKSSYNFLISSSSAQIKRGDILFSTNKALIYYHPDSLKETVTTLPLFFTNVKINNIEVTPQFRIRRQRVIERSINECSVIRVPYNTNVTLEFAALDFIQSDKIKYRYKMNSSEWISLERNQRSISFYNQNPGEYYLKIMAIHPSGFESQRSVTLIFLPPWWKTTWAYLLYFAIFVSLFVSYRYLILQRLRQKTKLEQEQFEKMKLQELDKLKTNFITNLVHEIRTPLSLIINPLEHLLYDKKLDLSVKEIIKTTIRNSYRLIKLTNELSDYTKIEKDLVHPEIKNHDLISILKEIFDSFKSLADTMGIDYQFYSAFDKLIMGTDKEMVEKIVFNLLSNAFKFTPKNGTIVLEVIQVEEQHINYAKIKVTNTGEGIAADKIDKIFDRFYQVNQANQGLGIGLSIVKSFVEMLGGFIRVQSIPGSETSFDLLLPMRNAPKELSNENQIKLNFGDMEARDSENSSPTAYKLLIVEDDEEIVQYLAKELSNCYKVYIAPNGKEGLKLAKNIVPDIIITDVLMPEMDGITFCRNLRTNVSTSHIPVIILSAKTLPEHQVEGLDAGANMYMVKPFHLQVLKNQIDRLIDLKETIYRKFFKESELIPSDVLNNDLDKQFMDKVLNYIKSNLTNPNLSVDELSNHVFLSKVQLYRKIKALTGMSVIEFITSIRLKTAAQLILERKMNFTQIAYETGFSSPSYFTKCFRQYFGKTPSEYILSAGGIDENNKNLIYQNNPKNLE
ncbi:MAG: response regulator [Bacteroidales bacterium]|nr:response regulator [Bacteroidales bacterium]